MDTQISQPQPKPSETFLDVQMALKEIRIKLTELSRVDLTNLHIDQEWSLIPYVKDHIDFLIEQTNGVEDALRDCRPPVTPDEIAKIIEQCSK